MAEDATTEETTDVEETDEEETEETEAEEWTPPSKEDWVKLNESAKLARTEAANRRKWLKENGIDPRSGKKLGAETAAPVTAKADDKALREASKRAEESDARATRALAAAVKRELKAQGVVADMVDLALPRIKLDDLDLDDDGDIDGLEDQIEALKAKHPTLFAPKEEPVKRTKSAGGTVRQDKASKQPSFADALRQSAGL